MGYKFEWSICRVSSIQKRYRIILRASKIEKLLEKVRLEVSGIRKGDSSRVKARVKQRKEQIKASDGQFPAYVIVVEFSTPLSYVERFWCQIQEKHNIAMDLAFISFYCEASR